MVKAVYNSVLQEMIDLLEEAQNRGYAIKEFQLTRREWQRLTDWVPTSTQEERQDLSSLAYWPPGYILSYPPDTTTYAAYLASDSNSKVCFRSIPIRVIDDHRA